VTLSLYHAYLDWGDTLYKHGQPAEALARYTQADAVLRSDPRAGIAAEWARLRQELDTADAGNWPRLLETLKQRALQTPGERDPAGSAIETLLYDAYVHYGDALIAQGGLVAESVRAQAEAALTLAAAAKDQGQAARELKARAEKLSTTSGAYKLEWQKIDSAALWLKELQSRKLPQKQDQKSVNLIVINNNPNPKLTLTLTRPDSTGPQPLLFDAKGFAFAAIESQPVILKLTNGAQTVAIPLEFSNGETYLVRVQPQ
jgi:hypothetical protein